MPSLLSSSRKQLFALEEPSWDHISRAEEDALRNGVYDTQGSTTAGQKAKSQQKKSKGTKILVVPHATGDSLQRRKSKLTELSSDSPVEDAEMRKLHKAFEISEAEAAAKHAPPKAEADAQQAARPSSEEEGSRTNVEAEARRVAAQVLSDRQERLRRLDDSRRLPAVEAFVARAATALNEYGAGAAQLRRAALTIGVVAASRLLEQTLVLEAAGGILRNDGSGQRRTAGGVFLGVLLRDNISKDEYKHIQAVKPAAAVVRSVLSASGGYIWLRGGPIDATAEETTKALQKQFGPVAKEKKMRLRLRTTAEAEEANGEGAKDAKEGVGHQSYGKAAFYRAKDRAAALAMGEVTLPNGRGRFILEARPTAGLHFAAAPKEVADVDDFDEWCMVEEPWDETWSDAGGSPVASRDAGSAERAAGHAASSLEEEEEAEWCPDDFICPITLELFIDPVVAADGLTYERAAIQKWLDMHAEEEAVPSPASGAPLSHRELVPNKQTLGRIRGVGRRAVRLR